MRLIFLSIFAVLFLHLSQTIQAESILGPGGIPTKPWIDPIPPDLPPGNPVEPPYDGKAPFTPPVPAPVPDQLDCEEEKIRLGQMIVSLQQQIHQLLKRIEKLEKKPNDALDHPQASSSCLKWKPRVHAAFFSIDFDKQSRYRLSDNDKKPFIELKEQGYLKEIPEVWSEFRGLTPQIYCDRSIQQ